MWTGRHYQKGGNTKRVPFLAKMVYKMLRGRTLGRSLCVWNLPPGREHSLCNLACPRFLFSFSQPLWLEAIKKRKGFFCSFLGMESRKLWVTSQFVEYKVFLNYSRESQTKNRVQNELFLRILGVTLWWTTHRPPISSPLYHMEMTGVLLSPFWGTGEVEGDGVVAVPFRQMYERKRDSGVQKISELGKDQGERAASAAPQFPYSIPCLFYLLPRAGPIFCPFSVSWNLVQGILN